LAKKKGLKFISRDRFSTERTTKIHGERNGVLLRTRIRRNGKHGCDGLKPLK
jgi:hypothetical protein